MRILLTNDDGIYAPGLQAMRKELMAHSCNGGARA